ncbi:receptor-like serine/threonine-protein kinase ALE2 [Selaginella moellendorffii]|nr:receptor-like serine/threonine-protein kinase ALE2 [Selaginella moellendorffii]|eukprot:XP_002975663.2 receptor-like serine/threonine-protein kinase ALE2 [Selaginella moellendorffii]
MAHLAMSFGNAVLVVLSLSALYIAASQGVLIGESEIEGLGRRATDQTEKTHFRRFLLSGQHSPSYQVSIASAPTTGHHHHRHHRHDHAPAPTHRGHGGVVPAQSPHHRRHVHIQAPTPGPGPSVSPMPPPGIIPSLPAPSTDCHERCTDPFTSTAGEPCGCVIPMLVSLQLGVPPYVFFPQVSELASELAAGTSFSQSQVRILGANTVENNMDETEVKAELVPLGAAFDNATALRTAHKFWNHEVGISEDRFGSYSVLYVRYPGLPPSPPSPGSNAGGPTSSKSPYEQPLSVNVKKRRSRPGTGTIAVVVLTALLAVICLVAVWFAWRCKHAKQPMMVEPMLPGSSVTKKSGGGSMLSSSMASSTSISYASSFTPYTGSAKTFTLLEIERATNGFKTQNIIGEGGFGRVYHGILDDNTRVAVKVLTRDDHQGGREFAAEVEMLSRLHHRNLVKLLGICIEEHTRCLVFELISNGSVESHLHGIDQETSPLDWETRLKIALGAARGLAYLHEDSNPRVIHRDFKASNILLEEDFTPKVSDFGLAKAASDEMSTHISTRVMGTFGYVAPEYAMTGHLLVKSDVYSYGVVLLELLSGRKPVDMSQPPGQENLVTWARPLLNSKEGLEILVDPALNNVPFDNLVRVAAIASMCVQPDVSHRPLMGEVVQALKLVYNDSDASDGIMSGNGSMHRESQQQDVKSRNPFVGGGGTYANGGGGDDERISGAARHCRESDSFISIDYDSGTFGGDRAGRQQALSNSESFIVGTFASQQQQCASAPTAATSIKPKRPWYRVRNADNGTVSESALLRYKRDDANRNDHSDIWLL